MSFTLSEIELLAELISIHTWFRPTMLSIYIMIFLKVYTTRDIYWMTKGRRTWSGEKSREGEEVEEEGRGRRGEGKREEEKEGEGEVRKRE